MCVQDMYPDESTISLPPNPHVPKDFPGEAWYSSGEMRSYNDQGAAFTAAGFTEDKPTTDDDMRHIRRGYFAATSFTDAQMGKVLGALDAAGPSVADNTVTLLWSDHGWHLGDTNSWCKSESPPDTGTDLTLRP